MIKVLAFVLLFAADAAHAEASLESDWSARAVSFDGLAQPPAASGGAVDAGTPESQAAKLAAGTPLEKKKGAKSTPAEPLFPTVEPWKGPHWGDILGGAAGLALGVLVAKVDMGGQITALASSFTGAVAGFLAGSSIIEGWNRDAKVTVLTMMTATFAVAAIAAFPAMADKGIAAIVSAVGLSAAGWVTAHLFRKI